MPSTHSFSSKKGFLLCLIPLLLLACKSQETAQTKDTLASQYTDTLTVAPYLYVPRLDQFTDIMRAQWAKLHPETYLEITTEWDCYEADPPDSIEVFVYDGIFYNHFLASGYLSEIPASAISDPEDVLPYALEAGKSNGKYYSLPQIGCGNILFWRTGDAGLENAQSLGDMLQTIGMAQYSSVRPPNGEGLLIDLSGGTTDACYYTTTDMQINDSYSATHPPQPTCQNLHTATLDSLQLLVGMAGQQQAAFSDTVNYMRAIWFGEGTAQAVVGFTEYLCYMNYDAAQVHFKPLPIGNASFTPFYIDMVGINSQTPADLTTKAQDLADLISSSAYETAAFGPDDSGVPQYLMPIRWSVFDNLGKGYPLYQEMKSMVSASNPKAFLLDANSRNWLTENKSCIRDSILKGPGPEVPGGKGK